MSPLTHVLTTIFVKGFYRAHSGMLLFFFVAVITYGFFIEVLNKTHLEASEVAPNHLLIVLTIITSPVMLILVGVLWLVYTIKTVQYARHELAAVSNLFLQYSTNSISKVAQFRSWLSVQLLLSAPALLYWCFAIIIGVIYGHYRLPLFFLVYILLLAMIAAMIHLSRANRLRTEMQSGTLLTPLKTWHKPFWTLYLFHLISRQRIAFLVTKLLSMGTLTAGNYFLLTEAYNPRAIGIVTLGVITSHSFLVFNSYRFEKSFLSFSRNLPYSKTKRYCDWGFCFLALMLPEFLWILVKFETTSGLMMLAFCLATALLYRSLLYTIAEDPGIFLKLVFFTFVSFFLVILMKLLLPLIVINLLLSMMIFKKYYFKQRDASA